MSEDEIELAFRKFDKDGDRNITFNEFCDTLKYYETMYLNSTTQS